MATADASPAIELRKCRYRIWKNIFHFTRSNVTTGWVNQEKLVRMSINEAYQLDCGVKMEQNLMERETNAISMMNFQQ